MRTQGRNEKAPEAARSLPSIPWAFVGVVAVAVACTAVHSRGDMFLGLDAPLEAAVSKLKKTAASAIGVTLPELRIYSRHQDVEHEWKAADGNSDGKVTPEEFEASLLAMGIESGDAKKLMGEVDTDGSGSISEAEYKTAFDGKQTPKEINYDMTQSKEILRNKTDKAWGSTAMNSLTQQNSLAQEISWSTHKYKHKAGTEEICSPLVTCGFRHWKDKWLRGHSCRGRNIAAEDSEEWVADSLTSCTEECLYTADTGLWITNRRPGYGVGHTSAQPTPFSCSCCEFEAHDESRMQDGPGLCRFHVLPARKHEPDVQEPGWGRQFEQMEPDQKLALHFSSTFVREHNGPCFWAPSQRNEGVAPGPAPGGADSPFDGARQGADATNRPQNFAHNRVVGDGGHGEGQFIVSAAPASADAASDAGEGQGNPSEAPTASDSKETPTASDQGTEET